MTAQAEAAMRRALDHHRRRRLPQAISGYDKALGLSPDAADTLHLKAAALSQAGRLEEAVPLMERAFRLRPERKFGENACRKLLEAMAASGAESTPPLLAWSTALVRVDRPEEALALAQYTLGIDPDNARAQFQHGACLERNGRSDAALAAYRRAIEIDPAMALAHFRLGSLFSSLGRWVEAIGCFERGLAIEPDNTSAVGNLLMARRFVCDWRDDRAWVERLMAACARARREGLPPPINPSFAPVLPFSQPQLRALAELHARRLFKDLEPLRRRLAFDFSGRRTARRRLRVAYLSEGFRNFPTAHLIQRLFRHHDRDGFEVFAYSYGPDDGSDYRRTIAADVDRFVDVRNLSDQEAARRIHEDAVDILVDLKGYTINARPRITALRPAPVQVSYLGYPGTWGCRAVDYFVADRIVAPFEDAPAFTEALVHLPDCYQVNDNEQRIDESPMSRTELGLPESGFVFCCFNKPYKIETEVFSLWMTILADVSGSVLWLFGDNEAAEQNLRREAERRGIAGERLVFARGMDKPRHLARHRLADLFLDTRICSAHTTAADALWAGLPLIAWPAPTFHGRVAASLLSAAGLPELIVETPDAYRALALRLARRPEALTGLKSKLSALRGSCRLFDTARFALGLEAAYRRMWENYLADRHPGPIAIGDEDLPNIGAMAASSAAARPGTPRSRP